MKCDECANRELDVNGFCKWENCRNFAPKRKDAVKMVRESRDARANRIIKQIKGD